MLFDVLQETDRAGKLHAVDGLGGLASIFEGNPKERASRLRGLGLIIGGSGVADLRNFVSLWIFRLFFQAPCPDPIPAAERKIQPSELTIASNYFTGYC